MPVTWNIGSTASATEPLAAPRQWQPAVEVDSTVEWVCMQPLGLPVVPEV